jgi:hypothetical protein
MALPTNGLQVGQIENPGSPYEFGLYPERSSFNLLESVRQAQRCPSGLMPHFQSPSERYKFSGW